MDEFAAQVLPWLTDGRPFALCVVVDTWSSAPQPVGAMMVVDDADHVIGGLSGGCVEGDVVARAERAMASGIAERAHYGVSDSDAMGVGLPCGGHIDVVIAPMTPGRRSVLEQFFRTVTADGAVALALITADEEAERLGEMKVLTDQDGHGTLTSERVDAAVTDDGRGQLGIGQTGKLSYGPDGERLGSGLEVLVVVRAPRPRMIIFGAIDHADALSRAAQFVGYHVTICDARALFATRARFPKVDDVVVDRPARHLRSLLDSGGIDQRTVLIDLTHDLKFDIPLLQLALDPQCPAGFVGAMGSRRTNEVRREQLLADGMPASWWDRLHTPVGLDIGARTPEGTAISIMAEVIADQWQGSGAPLYSIDGAIHREG